MGGIQVLVPLLTNHDAYRQQTHLQALAGRIPQPVEDIWKRPCLGGKWPHSYRSFATKSFDFPVPPSMKIQWKLDLADTDLAENLDLKDTPQKIWATIFDFYYISPLTACYSYRRAICQKVKTRPLSPVQ